MSKIVIDEKKVRHVASLARLKISENRLKEVSSNLQKIIDHMDELERIDTKSVAPMFSPVREFTSFYEEGEDRRKDLQSNSLGAEKILQNAPDKKQNQFSVKAVIEES